MMDYHTLKAHNAALNQEELRAGRTVLHSKPIEFWFDLCGPCNLHCAHCAYRLHGRSSEQEVSEPVYATVVRDLLPTATVCHLGGTNYGEMTLSRHFHRFLCDCKTAQVQLNLTTNGTRLHPSWFDDLLDTLTVIGFSMEGMEAAFEKIRGFKWRVFLRHVEQVCAGRAARGKTFRVEWRFCAHADNIHQLPEMIRVASRVGVDRIQVLNLVPYLAEQQFKKLYYHRSLANHYFAEAQEVAAALHVEVNVPPLFDTGAFPAPRPPREASPAVQPPPPPPVALPRCYQPWRVCSINELGIVTPDAVYWRPAGDLTRQPFAAIWNGRRYRQLRASVNRQPHSICYSCRMPSFDSADNLSAAQEQPGRREHLRTLLTPRRRHVVFTEAPPAATMSSA
jgi:MoaA/NifB/PqqE/SkfB family radical SAM enzyme